MNGIQSDTIGKDMYKDFSECKECKECSDNCKKLAKHYIDINLPVEIKPDANVGKIEMECCGEPEVLCDNPPSARTCHLMLVQKVCIKIPITYTFKHEVSESMIDCCGDKCNK